MFKKVLVSEDLVSIITSIHNVLKTAGVIHIEQTQYCDEAYVKLINAYKNKEPYDLLITDLSFKPDHRKSKIASGEELIKTIKTKIPDLKIIIFSIEDRPAKIEKLFYETGVNAFVCKGRSGLKELDQALTEVYNGSSYLSPSVVKNTKPEALFELNPLDIKLLQLLAQGLSQTQISQEFKKQNLIPGSLSAIEKQINRLRTNFGAKNTIHLIAIAKDMGVL